MKKRICIYCGSNPGRRDSHTNVARQLVTEIVNQGMGVVYGGAQVGLMGVVADTALATGGEVIGVIPQSLVDKEVAHQGLSDLIVVDSMHARKARMVELADGFVALPGGAGTMDELFEVLTWAQLGFHQKPCGLLNVDGYYDGIASFLETAVNDGFLKDVHRQLLLVDDDPGRLLKRFAEYRAPRVTKWINKDEL